MSINSEYARNVANILQGKAAAQADAQRQSGQIWGNTIATLAQVIPPQVQQAIQANQVQRKKQQALSIIQQHGGINEKSIEALTAFDPELGMDMGKRLMEAKTATFKYQSLEHEAKQKKLEFLANVVGSARDENSYAQALLIVKELGGDVSKAPPHYDPTYVESMNRLVMSAKERLEMDKPKSADLAQIVTPGADGQPVTRFVEKKAGTEYPMALTPDQAADNARQTAIAQASAAEQARDNARADQQLAVSQGHLAIAKEQAKTGAHERIVQVMGPNGVPIWVRESQAVNQPAAQAPRAVTEAERKALAFYNRAKEAIETITTGAEGNTLEDKVAKSGLGTQLGLQYAPNLLQTSSQQAYRQAQRAFTEARLRKESGAAIPTAEYENDARTYFAQPGDDPTTVAQKRKSRETVLAGLKFGAGRAYDEYYGEPNVSPARGSTPKKKQTIGRFEVEID